jgi:ABC-type Fe3+-siderophore transport system permease subunit
MSIQTLIFVGASVVVVIALLYALLEWSRVYEKVRGLSGRAALLFCACFLLYACGQTLVIFQVLGAMAFNEWA